MCCNSWISGKNCLAYISIKLFDNKYGCVDWGPRDFENHSKIESIFWSNLQILFAIIRIIFKYIQRGLKLKFNYRKTVKLSKKYYLRVEFKSGI